MTTEAYIQVDGKSTRRGFLFGLLGGLAGAAGLSAAAKEAQTPRAGAAGGGAASGSPAAAPIDNIFTPIRSSQRKDQQGGV